MQFNRVQFYNAVHLFVVVTWGAAASTMQNNFKDISIVLIADSP